MPESSGAGAEPSAGGSLTSGGRRREASARAISSAGLLLPSASTTTGSTPAPAVSGRCSRRARPFRPRRRLSRPCAHPPQARSSSPRRSFERGDRPRRCAQLCLLVLDGLAAHARRVLDVRGGQGLLLIAGTVATAAIPWLLAREIARRADGHGRVLGFALSASLALGLVAALGLGAVGLSFASRTVAVTIAGGALLIFLASVPRWLPPGFRSIRGSGDAPRHRRRREGRRRRRTGRTRFRGSGLARRLRRRRTRRLWDRAQARAALAARGPARSRPRGLGLAARARPRRDAGVDRGVARVRHGRGRCLVPRRKRAPRGSSSRRLSGAPPSISPRAYVRLRSRRWRGTLHERLSCCDGVCASTLRWHFPARC